MPREYQAHSPDESVDNFMATALVESVERFDDVDVDAAIEEVLS